MWEYKVGNNANIDNFVCVLETQEDFSGSRMSWIQNDIFRLNLPVQTRPAASGTRLFRQYLLSL